MCFFYISLSTRLKYTLLNNNIALYKQKTTKKYKKTLLGFLG